jgi:Stealth protein CR3, conserved region 3
MTIFSSCPTYKPRTSTLTVILSFCFFAFGLLMSILVFGPVLRMQSDLLVKPHRENIGASAEWQALEYTNGLISSYETWIVHRVNPISSLSFIGDRFGTRFRPYSAHQARALSVSIMRELTSIWAEQIDATASRPFRGTSHGLGDLYMSFLVTHFIVERWREALLWTFVVAKIGSADGVWGEAEAQSAWQAVGGATGSIETKVLRGERETLEFGRVRRILEKGGHGDQTFNSRRTTYVFCES